MSETSLLDQPSYPSKYSNGEKIGEIDKNLEPDGCKSNMFHTNKWTVSSEPVWDGEIEYAIPPPDNDPNKGLDERIGAWKYSLKNEKGNCTVPIVYEHRLIGGKKKRKSLKKRKTKKGKLHKKRKSYKKSRKSKKSKKSKKSRK